MHHQVLRRPIENTADEVRDHGLDHLVLGPRGTVNISAFSGLLLEMTLTFQNPHHGKYSGVGYFAAFADIVVDLPHGSLAPLPDRLEDFEFQAGGDRFLRFHSLPYD